MTVQKRSGLSKYWVFTWNNYPVDHMDHFHELGKDLKWIFGYEVGENGTPHLQGYLECDHRIRPIEYCKLPKEIHFEKRKGTRLQNIKYCCKDGKVKSRGIRAVRPIIVAEPTGWQKEVAQLVEGLPDGRTIIWVWEPVGNRGKTQLARWLCHTQGAVYLNGAKRHVLATAFKHEECDLFIFGVPRSMDEKGPPVSYAALEQLKDGLFHSGFGTEATGMCLRNPPHILVLANEPPNKTRLSEDRWKIGVIEGEHIIWD